MKSMLIAACLVGAALAGLVLMAKRPAETLNEGTLQPDKRSGSFAMG